jgi:hypothetical protein
MKRWMLAMAVAAGICWAQDAAKEPPKFYKLEFVVKELDGAKVLSARNYSMQVSTNKGGPGQIRAGSKVRVGNQTQWTTVDVGTSVDVHEVREVGNDIAFALTAEVSSVLQDNAEATPVIRQNRWSSDVTVPIKKPTVVFASDDNTTKHVMEVEVTATPR